MILISVLYQNPSISRILEPSPKGLSSSSKYCELRSLACPYLIRTLSNIRTIFSDFLMGRIQVGLASRIVQFTHTTFWLLCPSQKIYLCLPHLLPSTTAKPCRVRIEIRYHGLVLLMSFFHIDTKGQLISKCLFGVFNSCKKRTIQPEVSLVAGSNFFVRFWKN